MCIWSIVWPVFWGLSVVWCLVVLRRLAHLQFWCGLQTLLLDHGPLSEDVEVEITRAHKLSWLLSIRVASFYFLTAALNALWASGCFMPRFTSWIQTSSILMPMFQTVQDYILCSCTLHSVLIRGAFPANLLYLTSVVPAILCRICVMYFNGVLGF